MDSKFTRTSPLPTCIVDCVSAVWQLREDLSPDSNTCFESLWQYFTHVGDVRQIGFISASDTDTLNQRMQKPQKAYVKSPGIS